MSRSGWASLVGAVGGLLVAGYLTYSHYAPESLYCTVGDCKTVQNSEYAMLGPIPVAVLGLLMFAALIGLAVVRERQPAREFTITSAMFGMTLLGVLFYIYLTYLEIWVIHAVCQWCVISSLFTLAVFVLESWRLCRWRRRSTTPRTDDLHDLGVHGPGGASAGAVPLHANDASAEGAGDGHAEVHAGSDAAGDGGAARTALVRRARHDGAGG